VPGALEHLWGLLLVKKKYHVGGSYCCAYMMGQPAVPVQARVACGAHFACLPGSCLCPSDCAKWPLAHRPGPCLPGEK
jgi:hypothetical protein